MTVFHEARHAGEFILSEANGHRSRENVTIAAEQDVAAGAVLGKVTASGQFVPLDPSAEDGSEEAAAIAIYKAKTGEGETVDIAAIVRDAEVNGHILTWPEGISEPDTAAAVAELAALGVIVR